MLTKFGQIERPFCGLPFRLNKFLVLVAGLHYCLHSALASRVVCRWQVPIAVVSCLDDHFAQPVANQACLIGELPLCIVLSCSSACVQCLAGILCCLQAVEAFGVRFFTACCVRLCFVRGDLVISVTLSSVSSPIE